MATSGVARIWCQGARRSRRRRSEHRRAEGAEWGRVWGGEGCPLPSRGLGSVVSSPSGVRGWAPAAIAFSACFRPQNASGSKKNTILLQIPVWKSCRDRSPPPRTKLRLCVMRSIMDGRVWLLDRHTRRPRWIIVRWVYRWQLHAAPVYSLPDTEAFLAWATETVVPFVTRQTASNDIRRDKWQLAAQVMYAVIDSLTACICHYTHAEWWRHIGSRDGDVTVDVESGALMGTNTPVELDCLSFDGLLHCALRFINWQTNTLMLPPLTTH